MSALRELSVIFDVNTGKALKNLGELTESISTAKGALTQIASSLVGAFALNKAKDFIAEQIEMGSRINDTSDRLGVTTDALQQFQFAAGLSGVGAEEAGKALGFLNKNLGAAAAGGAEQAKTFASLGIDLASVKDGTLSATDLLPQLADKFAGMSSDAERTAVSMQIFGKGGASLLPFLKQGSKGIAELTEEFNALGGGMSADFISKADQAGDEIDKMKFATQGLKSSIAGEVLPTLTNWVKKISHAIAEFRKWTKETYVVQEALGLVGVAATLAAGQAVIGWAKFFGLFPKGNAGILRTAVSFGWVGLAIVAVVGLAAVLEDLFVGIHGGDSVVKDWIESVLGVEGAKTLFDNFGQIVDQISASFSNMSPAVLSIVEALAQIAISPSFVAAIEYVVRLLGSTVALLIGSARAAGNLVIGDTKGAGKAVDEAGNAVFGKAGFFGSDAMKPYTPSVARNAQPDAVAYGPPTAEQYPAQNISQNITTMPTINIVGSADPKATAEAVASAQRLAFSENAQEAKDALARGPVTGAISGRGSKL